MSTVPDPRRPTPIRLFDLLRSWVHAGLHPADGSPQSPARELARPGGAGGGALRVLVVDDNPVNQMMLTALLAHRGLVPALAADGAQAVALVRESPFDLILMDLQMPVLDGLGATTAIRGLEDAGSWPAVPVVAYSSTTPAASVLAMHGLNGSLAKPCGDEELEACLLRWCPGYQPEANSPSGPDGAASLR